MPPDNATPVPAGGAVDFPQDGPTNPGSTITRVSVDTFRLGAVGFYEVNFQVSVTEPGQLVLAIDSDGAGPGLFVELDYTVVGRATGTSQIVGLAIIEVTDVNTLLQVRNPIGNTPALAITPLAGGAHPVSAHLVIKQIL